MKQQQNPTTFQLPPFEAGLPTALKLSKKKPLVDVSDDNHTSSEHSQEEPAFE